MRITLLALFVAACTPAPSPPPADPPAPSASASASASATPDDGCKRDLDCPIVMGMHQPCCVETTGHGRCSTLPPKADACPNEHLCLADSDCIGGASCVVRGNVKTCKGGTKLGGPSVPGECINAAPGTKLPDYCSHPK